MAKSVVNEEFAAIADSHFAKAGFVRRRKGQRYMPDLPPLTLVSLPDERTEFLGTGPGYGSHGEVIQYDHLVATLPDGRRYPCYRRHDPARKFALCHSLQYVPAKV